MTPSNDGSYVPQDQIEITEYHGDLSQEVLKITVDRLELILRKHLERTERARDWIAPAGIFASLVVTFGTTTFKDFGLKADVWQAIFIVTTVLVLVWLAKTLHLAKKSESLEHLIECLKESTKD